MLYMKFKKKKIKININNKSSMIQTISKKYDDCETQER